MKDVASIVLVVDLIEQKSCPVRGKGDEREKGELTTSTFGFDPATKTLPSYMRVAEE